MNGTQFYPLFKHMSDAHKLTLLDSELLEICLIAQKIPLSIRGVVDGAEYERLYRENQELRRLADIGAKWESSSSLEEWFPITAERLTRLEADRKILRDALAALVGEDDPADLEKVRHSIEAGARLWPNFTKARETIAAVNALLQVRP